MQLHELPSIKNSKESELAAVPAVTGDKPVAKARKVKIKSWLLK